MKHTQQAVVVTVTAVLAALTIISAVVLYRIRYLSLPVSQITAVATLFIPAVTGFSLQQSIDFAFSGKTRGRFAMTVTVLLIVYYTVIVTLSMTHMVPPKDLTCGLEQQWLRLFVAKDQIAIKRIQDSHQCCGLHSAKDKAWPFPGGNHGNDACLNAFGREKPCFRDWRRDEQIVGGLMVLVVGITALIKLFSFLSFRSRTSWLHPGSIVQDVTEHGDPEDATQHAQRRARLEAPYRDTTEDDALSSGGNSPHTIMPQDEEHTTQNVRSSLTVQPSRLQGEGSEWER